MADLATGLSDEQINDLLEQAEARLIEKQAQQGKNVVPRAAKQEVANTNATEASTSKHTAPAPSKPKAEELSVRVPEARKSKKELVCCRCYVITPTFLLPDENLSQFN